MYLQYMREGTESKSTSISSLISFCLAFFAGLKNVFLPFRFIRMLVVSSFWKIQQIIKYITRDLSRVTLMRQPYANFMPIAYMYVV